MKNRNLQKCSNSQIELTWTFNMSIFDAPHRDELRAYTRRLLKVVEAKAQVDLTEFRKNYLGDEGDLIMEAMCPSEQCKHYNYKNKLGTPCTNCRRPDSLYCAVHQPQDIPDMLEYCLIAGGAYLYDPIQFKLYRYDTREYVGRYIEGTIICDLYA
jgi:hypothetical protein